MHKLKRVLQRRQHQTLNDHFSVNCDEMADLRKRFKEEMVTNG